MRQRGQRRQSYQGLAYSIARLRLTRVRRVSSNSHNLQSRSNSTGYRQRSGGPQLQTSRRVCFGSAPLSSEASGAEGSRPGGPSPLNSELSSRRSHLVDKRGARFRHQSTRPWLDRLGQTTDNRNEKRKVADCRRLDVIIPALAAQHRSRQGSYMYPNIRQAAPVCSIGVKSAQRRTQRVDAHAPLNVSTSGRRGFAGRLGCNPPIFSNNTRFEFEVRSRMGLEINDRL